jgi:Spy/CpxP family protein refolding chaperone
VFRKYIGALALAAAMAVPLAASAQTVQGPAPAGPGAFASGMQAHAHGWQHRRRHHRNPFMHALHALNLTPAQRQQIVAAMRSARTAERQARIASAQELRGKIDAVLTPDQRTQLHAALAHGPHGQHGPRPGFGAPNGAPNPPAQ